MAVSFVPSLQHLTCSRVVTSLFNHFEVHKDFQTKKIEEIHSQVTEKISHLTPCIPIQKMLKRCINPLINEVDNWLKFFETKWYGFDHVFESIPEPFPYCWLSDGTIDREIAVKSLVKNEKNRPMNRFIFACVYCLFDDALQIWENLFKIEKAYLRHQSTDLIKHWVDWLESSSNKDWESFAAFTLGTDLWDSTLYILKHTLATLSPAERSQYLLKALTEKEVVSPDIMRFCISIMTKDEQERVFRESPVEVFRCISSWPMQSIFNHVMVKLQPYLTEETFLSMLQIVFLRIRYQYEGFGLAIEVLQNLWSRTPQHLRDIALNNIRCSKPLLFLLAFDVSQVFAKEKFLDCYKIDTLVSIVLPMEVLLHERTNDRRRRVSYEGTRRHYIHML